MRNRLALAIATAIASISLLGAASASAATEFGDACVADEAEAGLPVIYFEISNPANPLPTAAPVGGVLTGWRVNVVPVPFAFPITMKQVRQTSPTTLTVVGEATAALVGGANLIPARLPIQAGDRLGVSQAAPLGVLVCESPAPESTVGVALNGAVGQSSPFETGSEPLRVPLVGVIEPDADGDGYGDETQDGCPQSALYHVPCPVIVVDTINVGGKSSAKILVATSSNAPVTVSGRVNLGNGASASLSAAKKTVKAGRLASFKLSYPRALKERLAELPPGRKLTLKVTARATNVAGKVSTDKSTAKLKGQG